jgi:2-oxoglutarate/2-oxoacid ferredoxin oxidoreductase subunit alpha
MGAGLEEVPAGDRAIVLAGEAGQGIQVIESLLTRAFRREGYHLFSSPEFMSRIRGGSNSTLLRIGAEPVRAWSDRCDLCIVFDQKAISHLGSRIGPATLVLGDGLKGVGEGQFIDVPLARLAEAAGGRLFTNTIAAGMLWGLFDAPPETLEEAVKGVFSGKAPEAIAHNLVAARSGMAAGRELRRTGRIPLSLPPPAVSRRDLHLTGTEAIALGAMAGGCNFASFYPMSPSTGVASFLAKHGRDFGIIVEQTEDEICAVTMALGAWYAGARALTTTSGGGFALMSEALSLAGITESPLVVLLAQRPGPATGLPTRTEQGDLNLALHAGHGDVPRIILAPGNPRQAFDCARDAFRLADSYQVPVIILTDQYLMDSGCDGEGFQLDDPPFESTAIAAIPGYRRYALTGNGVSPRAIPGWGSGLVACDSHEHNQDGHIDETPSTRTEMVDKRLRKLATIAENTPPPQWIGPEDATSLVICWGSTREIVLEAIACPELERLAVLHFQQLFPLHRETEALLQGVENLILVEGNASGQLGQLLRETWGISCQQRILKYNGRQFSVEELRARLEEIVAQGERT